MENKGNMSDRDWEELASIFSGEKENRPANADNKDMLETENKWKNLGNMEDEKPIDVDNAWNKVRSRINSDSKDDQGMPSIQPFRKYSFLRVAAAIIVLIGFSAIIFLNRTDYFSKEITIAAGNDQRNLKVDLPDGSTVFLNRNSRLSYDPGFGKDARAVKLTGEAFFDISPDKSKPFTIDAGKATVTVVGTSFSVNTGNENSEVEVFVTTGKVVLSDKESNESVELEPGYIGNTGPGIKAKSINEDPNYLAWNTGRLEYKGERLESVFTDLRKNFNMEIVADDASIGELTWTSPIEYISPDKIIILISRSFNLGYTKDGNVYHLYIE